MDKNVNREKNKYIYMHSTKSRVDVSPDIYRDHVRYHDAYRHKMQSRGCCCCPRNKWYVCDADCLVCQYHRAGNMISIDAPATCVGDDALRMCDVIADSTVPLDDYVADRIMVEQITQCWRNWDPDADRIIDMLAQGMSDRAIARQLGRPQRTFAGQMMQYRNKLHKMCNY